MNDDKLIRWRCRRGMKELDVMLERFLAHGFERLDDGQRSDFAMLLDSLDPDLFAWLSGSAVPDDARLRRAVDAVRDGLAKSAGDLNP